MDMRIGVTGHQKIADAAWVKQKILAILGAQNVPIIGVTSLAAGADQIFAEAVLESAGNLHVIVPFSEYANVFSPEGRKEYERLLSCASFLETLPAATSHEEAYLIAGKRLIDISELIVAVWDGKAAAGLGGTADVVQYAKSRGKDLIHINPDTRAIKRV
jgi:hypothetical protein